jgi:bacterioferritin
MPAKDPKMIALLNTILKNELTAINQYFLHSRMFKNEGLLKLAEKEYHESIDEMKHADQIIERVLFLDGLPNLQDLGKLHIGETVPERLKSDLAMEYQAVKDLRAAVAHAEKTEDFVTRQLCDAILKSEEEHIDWLDTQLRLVASLGEQNYLQLQV